MGGAGVRELDPGFQAGVGWHPPVWQGSCQEAAKLTPPALEVVAEGQAQLWFVNVALITPSPTPLPAHLYLVYSE